VLVLAATNRPEDLDEACLRRLTRRIYMPLPDVKARLALFKSKLSAMKQSFSEEDLDRIGALTEGYSMADLTTLIQEMAMLPVRELPTEELLQIKDVNDIRGIEMRDVEAALKIIVPSVSKHTIQEFEKWRKEKGQA
jgi:spastin